MLVFHRKGVLTLFSMVLFFCWVTVSYGATLYAQPDKTVPLSASSEIVFDATASGTLAIGVVSLAWSGFGAGSEHEGLFYTLREGSFGTALDCLSNTFDTTIVTTEIELNFTGTECGVVSGDTYTLDLSFAGNNISDGNITSDPYVILSDGSGSTPEVTPNGSYIINFVQPYDTSSSSIATSTILQGTSTIDFSFNYINNDGFGYYRQRFAHLKSGTFVERYTNLGTSSPQDFQYIFHKTGSWVASVQLCSSQEIGSCTSNVKTIRLDILENDGIFNEEDFREFVGLSDLDPYPKENCDFSLNPFATSTFSFSGCAGYLVTPSSTILSQYANQSGLENTIPAVYLYQAPQLVSSLFTPTTDNPQSIEVVVGDWDITLLSKEMLASVPLASTIKSLLSALLYFMLALGLYRKGLRMHDNHTPV